MHSNKSIEDVAAAATPNSLRFFQMCILSDKQLTKEFVSRAETYGLTEHIIITYFRSSNAISISNCLIIFVMKLVLQSAYSCLRNRLHMIIVML